MLLVVLFHSCGLYFYINMPLLPQTITTSLVWKVFAQWLNTFHVHTFTFVSGYVFYYLRYETHRYGDFKHVMGRKFNRLIVPYAFVLLVWVIPTYLAIVPFNFHDLLHRYILGEAPDQLWFLLMLFWVFSLGYGLTCLVAVDRITKKQVLVMVGGCYCISMLNTLLSLAGMPYWLQLLAAPKFLFFFVVGMVVRRFDWRILSKPGILLLLFALNIILFVLYNHLASNPGNERRLSMLLLPFVNLSGILFMFFLIQSSFCKIRAARSYQYVALFEKNSFGIYLFHQQLIFIIAWYLNKPSIPPSLTVAGCFVFSLVVSYGIVSTLNRLPLTRRLICAQ